MISYRYVISNSQGLHASNSMSLSRAASDYQSQITMTSSKGDANCKNVLALMSLNARQGETVVLNVDVQLQMAKSRDAKEQSPYDYKKYISNYI